MQETQTVILKAGVVWQVRNEYKHNLTGRSRSRSFDPFGQRGSPTLTRKRIEALGRRMMDDTIPTYQKSLVRELLQYKNLLDIRNLKEEIFPFSCSSMDLGLCKADHDRYTYSCIVKRQAKGETTRKRFCDELVADTIARARNNTHATPPLYLGSLSD